MMSALLFAFALSGSSATAPHPLVGVWQLRYPWHIEVQNGVATPTMETGTLTVTARGDSLIATLVTKKTSAFSPNRPRDLATRATPGPVVFVMRDQVTLAANGGADRQMTAVGTWTFNVTGDRLEGTLERQLEGVESKGHGPLRLTGTLTRR